MESANLKTLDEQVDIFSEIIREGHLIGEDRKLSLSVEKLSSNVKTKHLLEYTDLIGKAHNAIRLINENKFFIKEDIYDIWDKL